MVDSQTISARGDYISTEADEIISQSDTVRQNIKESNSYSTSLLYNFFDQKVGLFCQHYELEKPQIFLGVTLLILLSLFIFFTFLSWAYYRPIILNFHIKEELAKRQTEKDKKKEE